MTIIGLTCRVQGSLLRGILAVKDSLATYSLHVIIPTLPQTIILRGRPPFENFLWCTTNTSYKSWKRYNHTVLCSLENLLTQESHYYYYDKTGCGWARIRDEDGQWSSRLMCNFRESLEMHSNFCAIVQCSRFQTLVFCLLVASSQLRIHWFFLTVNGNGLMSISASLSPRW